MNDKEFNNQLLNLNRNLFKAVHSLLTNAPPFDDTYTMTSVRREDKSKVVEAMNDIVEFTKKNPKPKPSL